MKKGKSCTVWNIAVVQIQTQYKYKGKDEETKEQTESKLYWQKYSIVIQLSWYTYTDEEEIQ